MFTSNQNQHVFAHMHACI